MLQHGWEFFILDPMSNNINQTTQDKYLYMYNKAYETFLQQLCIPEPNQLFELGSDFTYYIDLTDDNIILDEKYDYTFLKSLFLNKKFKKIKYDIHNYYNSYDINVINIYVEKKGMYIILGKYK